MSSKLFKVLVTRRIPKEALEILKKKCSLDIWDSDECIPMNALNERIKNIDGLFCLLTDIIGPSSLDAAGSNLKVISTMSVGVDHIDLQECKKRGIYVGYTPDVLTAATAEFTVGLLLSTSRRIVESVKQAKCGGWGSWKPMWMCGPSLEGSTIGIVGLGRIGIATLKRLQPFLPKKVLYNNTRRKLESEEKSLGVEYASFNGLLEQSDFVICMAALNPESKNLFDSQAFQRMRNTAIFVNTARGGVVDQQALVEALTNKDIAGAGLDVTTPEPLPLDHPLFHLDNCVVTPHIASASLQTRTQMATLAAENLIMGLEGGEMPARYDIS